MANVKFSEFPSAATVGGSDIIPIVQGGINKKATVSVFSNYIGSGFVPYVGATTDLNLDAFDLYTAKVWLKDVPNDTYGSMELTDGVLHFEDGDGHSMVTMEDGYLTIANASTIRALLDVSALSANRDFAFPNASGTLALTSNLSSYLPLAGGTLTGALNGTSALFSSSITATNAIFNNSLGGNIGLQYGGTNDWVFGENAGAATRNFNIYNYNRSTIEFTINRTSGNLGLGTATPNDYSIGSTAKVLQVTGSAYGIINANAGSVYAWLIADTTAAAVGTQSNHDFKITTNNTERMRITSAGNVLIGTTTDAGYKLDVNGTARVSGAFATTSIKADGRIFSIGESNIGDLVTTNGAIVMQFDPTGQQGYINSRNYTTSTNLPINIGVSLKVKGSGVINIASIPTSPAGLSAGDIYSNLGILTIV